MAATTNIQVAFGITTVLATIIGILLYNKNRKEKVTANWEKAGYVKELCLYPLKSGKAIIADKVFCTEKGLKETTKGTNTIELRDRSFLIYKDDEVRAARQLPKLITIEIKAAENGVILSAPNKDDIYIKIPKVTKEVTVLFGKEPFFCTDCGDPAAKWVSSYLLEKYEGLRLGYGDGSSFRDVVNLHNKWAEHYTNMDNKMTGIFSDLAALHIINEASVNDINEKLPTGQEKSSFLNFRPNIVIEGPSAFDEDNWKYVKVGKVVAKVCLECLRCIETTVDQNGVMNKQREPLKTLERYRTSKGPFSLSSMGLYLKVIQTGPISKGDEVYISR